MNMIEKVAKAMALYEDSMEDYWKRYTGLAKAAIEAMREPSEEMIYQGPGDPYMDKEVWAKMIDAALKKD